MSKIDLDTLKSRVDLRRLAASHTTLQGREESTESYGPCPKCMGTDRFHVTRSWFFCRRCHPNRGDCVEYLSWLDGLDFRAACDRLARGHLPTLPGQRQQQRPAPSCPLNPPGPSWQAAARAFVETSQKLLWQPAGRAGLDYLHGRGFASETIRAAGLGYNPGDSHESPAKWGLESRQDLKAVWLPGPGIVIPWLIGGDYWRVNIRLLQPRLIKDDAGKETRVAKIGPAGWANGFFAADSVNPGQPVILCEGELDALTITQEAGNLIAAAATGGTEMSRRDKWIARLAAAPLVLVAFDAESAGDKAARFWLKTLPHARRWRPLAKDVNDMHRAGLGIRSWIEAGLDCYLPKPSPARWVDRAVGQAFADSPPEAWPVELFRPNGTPVYFNSPAELLAATL